MQSKEDEPSYRRFVDIQSMAWIWIIMVAIETSIESSTLILRYDVT
jgi:hypothetical protein